MTRPMFQRRHYIAVAAVLAEHLERARSAGDMFAVDSIISIADSIADVFGADNPRFKRGRFDAAATRG